MLPAREKHDVRERYEGESRETPTSNFISLQRDSRFVNAASGAKSTRAANYTDHSPQSGGGGRGGKN